VQIKDFLRSKGSTELERFLAEVALKSGESVKQDNASVEQEGDQELSRRIKVKRNYLWNMTLVCRRKKKRMLKQVCQGNSEGHREGQTSLLTNSHRFRLEKKNWRERLRALEVADDRQVKGTVRLSVASGQWKGRGKNGNYRTEVVKNPNKPRGTCKKEDGIATQGKERVRNAKHSKKKNATFNRAKGEGETPE